MGLDLSKINQRLMSLVKLKKSLTDDFNRKIKEIDEEIAIEENNLKRVSEILAPYICRACQGSGEEHFMDAAGSRDSRRCTVCHGSGISPQD